MLIYDINIGTISSLPWLPVMFLVLQVVLSKNFNKNISDINFNFVVCSRRLELVVIFLDLWFQVGNKESKLWDVIKAPLYIWFRELLLVLQAFLFLNWKLFLMWSFWYHLCDSMPNYRKFINDHLGCSQIILNLGDIPDGRKGGRDLFLGF